MSENSTGTVNPTDDGTDLANALTAITDADQIKAFQEYQRKEAVRKQKLQEAADKRKRENARGKNEDGTDRSALQASMFALVDLLRNWNEMYEEDPASLRRRVEEGLIPEIMSLATAGSTTASTALDGSRRKFSAMHAPHKATRPVDPNASTGSKK
jgi:hypothetical protein